MVNGVEFEHTHRLTASLVGLLTCLLSVSIWKDSKSDRLTRRWSLLAVLMVIIQGVLGGITVLLRLPTAVSVGHLGLSMLFFTLTIYLAFRTRFFASARLKTNTVSGIPRKAIVVGYCAVYLQIVVGALVRHTESGRACGTEIPSCAGGFLWPALAPQQLHMVHRWLGIAVFALIIGLTPRLAATARRHQRPMLRLVALALPWLTLTQVILGIATVTSRISLVIVTAHLGVAALILAGFAILFFGFGSPATPLPQKNHKRPLMPAQSLS